MTTMLERAARAVIEAEQDQWDLPAAEWDMKTLDAHGALSIARAVLMAVREPDDAVCEAGDKSDYVSSEGCDINYLNSDPGGDIPATGIVFTAMITAILNEPAA